MLSAGSSFRERFEELGYAGPVALFDQSECQVWKRRLEQSASSSSWFKGYAASSPAYFAIGSEPVILDRVAELIGDDAILWGASLVKRGPGEVHHWHTDAETGSSGPGSVSVWIGLENTSRTSSLLLASRSHRFGCEIEERAARSGRLKQSVRRRDVLTWAQELDAESEIPNLDWKDGAAIFFDGRLWHCSQNLDSNKLRTALLLQYARPDLHIRREPAPPCVVVMGSARDSVNRVVRAPGPYRPSERLSWVHTLALPPLEVADGGFRPHDLYRGATRCLSELDCHASVLGPEKTPHEPHQHAEEELLIILDGQAELVLEDDQGNRRRCPVRRGAFAYYPCGQRHTIVNPSLDPISYLIFRWTNPARSDGERLLPTGVFFPDGVAPDIATEKGSGFGTRRVFHGVTRHLSSLHCHLSLLRPGGGYDAHMDDHDVAIVLFSGTVETLGRQVSPTSVIFYSAGEPHGMKNVGNQDARYIVFEFHAATDQRARRSIRERALSRIPEGIKQRVPSGQARHQAADGDPAAGSARHRCARRLDRLNPRPRSRPEVAPFRTSRTW